MSIAILSRIRRAAVGRRGLAARPVTVILVTGVVMGLMTVVLSDRRPRGTTCASPDAAQVTDAGVQQAYFAVNNLLPTDTTTTSLRPAALRPSDGTYTWTATRPTGTR
jgi:hypothetical protein